MFRNFIYLNEDALRSYADQLEIGKGKIAAKKINIGAKAGPVKADAEFESREQSASLASLYNEFERALKDQTDKYFDFLTGNPDPSTLPPMSIVRFRGTAEVPESFDVIATMGHMLQCSMMPGCLNSKTMGYRRSFCLICLPKKTHVPHW